MVDVTRDNVVFYNPLPETTEEELFSMEKDIDSVGSKRKVFNIEYLYSPGNSNTQMFVWKPYGKLSVRYEIANYLTSTLEKEGLVVINANDTEEELIEKAIKGLLTVKDNFDQYGDRKILKYRLDNNFNDEAMDTRRHELQPYYVNRAKVKAVQAEINRLKKALKAKVSTATA